MNRRDVHAVDSAAPEALPGFEVEPVGLGLDVEVLNEAAAVAAI